MNDLTDRQQAVLDFIEAHLADEGVPPTLEEIARAFGFAQACGALKHVRKLEAAGYLDILPNRARGIRLKASAAASSSLLQLPLVGCVAAGLPILSEGHIERTIAIDRWLFRPRPHYLLQVSGTSMVDAGILDGDLIAVHRTPVAEHGQTVVARLGESGITVKRLYRRGRVLRLLPRSTEHAPIDPDPTEDFAIEGLYVGVLRRA